MSLEEFRLAVIGDEPAGLWLLRRYHETMVERGEPQRTAWLSLRPGPRTVAMPASLGAAFGIETGAPWSAELVSPERSLTWSLEGLAEAFPELGIGPQESDKDAKGGDPSPAQLGAIRGAIRRHPELLTYASAIWKFVGRTQRLNAESVVRGALLCTSLAHWNPQGEVPSETQRLSVNAAECPIEEVEVLSNGAISLKLRNQAPIVSHRWILNLTVHQLAQLATRSVEFNKLMTIAADMRSRSALYPLRMLVERQGIPCPVRPLSAFLDTETIPDIETETWPIELAAHAEHKVLTLWASAPQQASLEAILERFRQGLVRMNHLFPFLPATLRELSTALDMDTCASAAARSAALDELESARIELYDMTTFHTATRHAGLLALMPFVNCHLPYPMGTLHAAQTLLPALVGKKKKDAPSRRPPSESAGSP